MLFNKRSALFFSFFYFSFSSLLYSQDVYSSKEQSVVGFNIGITNTDIFRDTINYAKGFLVAAGFNYNLTISEKSTIGIEAIFTGKNVKKNSPIIKHGFFYIDYPIYFQYKFSENVKANFGAQFSQYIFSVYNYLDGSKSNGVHYKSLKTAMANDFGILAGAEFDCSKYISLTTRYSISTKSFLENSTPYFGVFQLSLKLILYKGYKQLFTKQK